MRTEFLDDVVVALLAVNNYPLDKAWNLLPALREAGMTSPDAVPQDIGEATVRLATAGYDRGLLTSMFAERIQNLMAAVRRGDLSRIDALIETKNKEQALELLCSVKGIGPRVATTAWSLWTSSF